MTPSPGSGPGESTEGVLVVEARPLVCEGLRFILESKLHQPVTTTSDPGYTIALLGELQPALVVAGGRAAEPGFVKRVRHAAPSTPVVVVLDEPDPAAVRANLMAGAYGCVGAASHPDTLLDAVRRALHSCRYVDPRIAAAARARRAVSPAARLTARELDVLRLVAAGYTSRRIGVALGLTTRTVERHCTHARMRLGLASRADVADFLAREGFLGVRNA